MITPEVLAQTGSEDGEQAALFCWANLAANYGFLIADQPEAYKKTLGKSGWDYGKTARSELRWLHAVPNGGSRHKGEAAKLVACGVRSGVADIFLPVPRFTAIQLCGLYIEMKRKNGKPSDWKPKQREFCEFVERQGYAYFVAYGWVEAKTIIESYLNGKVLYRLPDGRLRTP